MAVAEPVINSDLLYGGPTPVEALPESTEAEEVTQTVEEVEEESTEESEGSDEQTENESSDEEVSEELPEYEVTLEGESRKVTRSELIKGYQLESVATKKTMEAAEIRKAAEAKISQADQAIQALSEIESEVQSLLLGDVKNIDWNALRESDVSEYLRLKDVVAEREQSLQAIKTKRELLMKERTAKEIESLNKLRGWDDPVKYKQDEALITKFVTENGITQQIHDSKLFNAILKNAEDAEKYRKLRETKVATLKEVKKAPKSTKPQKINKAPAPKSATEILYG